MLQPFFIRPEPRALAEAPPAGDLLDAMGLMTTLPDQLIRDTAGHAYEPVQVSGGQDLMAHLGLLLRREPAGGAEPLIREKERQLVEQLPAQINRALAGAPGASRPVLQALQEEARDRKAQLEAEFAQLDQAYRTAQERLNRWQERAGQRSESLGNDVMRWVFGGPARMSLPEAVALWNDREFQALRRSALIAALECFTNLIEITSGLLAHLDETVETARQLLATLTQQCDQQCQPSSIYAPWTLRVDARAVADPLAIQVNDDRLVAELLRRLGSSGGPAALAEQVLALARTEAERGLQGRSVVDLVALEAGAVDGADDADPLLLVGQALLDALERSTWQLSRRARPRRETIQVTPDGAPAYSLEGLGSAAYGGGLDRLGFVQVQLGVAIDDLLLLHDGTEAFQAALRQRSLYVLDDLARAWEDAHTAEKRAAGSPNAAVVAPHTEPVLTLNGL